MQAANAVLTATSAGTGVRHSSGDASDHDPMTRQSDATRPRTPPELYPNAPVNSNKRRNPATAHAASELLSVLRWKLFPSHVMQRPIARAGSFSNNTNNVKLRSRNQTSILAAALS